MSSTYDIVSNAFNFSDFLSSGPDPRTGHYGFSINLGKILGGYGKGPDFELSISYQPTESKDWGFGKGWVPNFGYFDKKRERLVLTGGQSYSVTIQPPQINLDFSRIYVILI